MKKAYKIVRNMVLLLGVLLLLMAAFLLPTAVTKMEDRHLERESKSYEIDEIQITSNNTSLWETLEVFPNLIDSNFLMKQAIQISKYNLTEEKAQTQAEEFLRIIGGGQEKKIMDFSAQLTMMYSGDSGNVYAIWNCYACDSEENEYILWLDDATGKVVAFQGFWDMDWDLEKMSENLAAYYGCSYAELTDPYMAAKNGDGALRLLNKEKGKELLLPVSKFGDWISFNLFVYDGDISDSKAEEK